MKDMKRKVYSLTLLAIVLVGLVLTIFNVINWVTYIVVLVIVGILSKKKVVIRSELVRTIQERF